jgi:hypothetical protein
MTEQRSRFSMDGILPVSKHASADATQRLAPTLPARLSAFFSGKRFTVRRRATGILVLAILACAGTIILLLENTSPLPGSVTKHALFPLYYPSPVPDGYSYMRGSATIENGILFYALGTNNKSNDIRISEQAVPAAPPDLNHIAGFTTMQTLAGNTAIGTSLNKPMAIILSNTTLITITGSKSTPSDIVSEVARAMASLPR